MKYLYVILFAVIGGALRYELSLLMNDRYPVGTWLINVSGALLLGYLTVRLKRVQWSDALKSGMTGGLCGSFTTFSTFSMESIQLLTEQPAVGLCYIAATIIIGIFAALIGMRLAEVKV